MVTPAPEALFVSITIYLGFSSYLPMNMLDLTPSLYAIFASSSFWQQNELYCNWWQSYIRISDGVVIGENCKEMWFNMKLFPILECHLKLLKSGDIFCT